MEIANPIYDVVFRYLMNDNRVASLIISAIIGMKVKQLEFRATERSTYLEERSLTVYRLDFAATIITNEGEQKKILIEIQKAKFPTDILRFRRYLGEEYRNKENWIQNESSADNASSALPIVTIYFLGYTLENTKAPIIHVNRTYIDAVTGKEIEKQEPFIESLTHDSYVVQIPYIRSKRKNEVLNLLRIFDQGLCTDKGEGHILQIDEDNYPKKYDEVIRRLQKAIAEPKVRQTMDLEDEIIEDLKSKERMIQSERAEKEKALEEKEKALEEKEKERAEKEKALEEKENALAELEKLRKLLKDR